MIYTKKQLALMKKWQKNSLSRINLLEGSVSSGKTWISLVLWAFWVQTMPDDQGSLYLMAARSLTTLKRNCLLLLQELVGESNFTFSMSAKEGRLFGRHILFEGANDAQAEAKIRGLTLQGAYCDELTKMQEDFFAMLLSRLRRPGAKLFATTNPDAPGHWLKTEYLDRADELGMLDIKFLLEDNTTLDPEYVRAIQKEYTGVYYERFILGRWVVAEGLIYPMFADAIGEPPAEAAEKTIISIDYGTQNPFAAILWEKHGKTWYAVKEYYHSGRDTRRQKTDAEYVEDMEAFAEGLPGTVKVIIDPSAASFIAALRKRPKFSVMKADNSVSDGIRETATAMSKGIIKISPGMTNWRDEASGYVWDDNDEEDRPVKANDHLMDAMRYFVKTMRVAVPKGERAPLMWG